MNKYKSRTAAAGQQAKPPLCAAALLALAMLGTASATWAAGHAKKAAPHSAHHGDHAPHWSYTGKTGAAAWGELEPGFATCKLGREQSPIDIRGATPAALPALGFDYQATGGEVINNGHTIQVNLASGSGVKLASGAYKLLQFHLHTPSEEKIEGRAFPMVAHLVHRNEGGQLAVVAVLFKLGRVNPVLARVLTAMPGQAGAPGVALAGLNPADLLPAQTGYYAFTGSLTTPPCSEGVRWQVLKTPVELSEGQLAAFKALYPMNARPVQPLNGRSLQQSL